MRERLVELGLATVLAVALSTELMGSLQLIGRTGVVLVWIGILALWVWGLKPMGALLVWVGALALCLWGLELVGTVHWLARPGVVLVWIGILALWVWHLREVRLKLERDWVMTGLVGAAAGLWLVEGLTAIVSPPNSSDAMAYHMPRVVYWIQQQSVDFFATPYLNQIMLQPLHEYLILHFQLLSGGDRFANCVAWLATGGTMIAVSLVARALGAAGRGQALAAFCVATLPNGILQASGVKNEALLSFLLVSLVYFALMKRRWAVAVACGLACFTKGTAYLFAGPLVLLLLPRAIPQAALLVLVINGAFFMRNVDLSGSPLGFDSAQADGKYRWRNEYLSWQPMASNLLRHFSEQLGARSEDWNQRVYRTTIGAHELIGLRANDAATTWPHTEYVAPRNANHETDANNRWHFGLLLIAAGYFAWRREKLPLLIFGAMAIGVVSFCFYLKWQPFMLRMWLPMFSLGMVMVGVMLGRQHWLLQAGLCVFLLDACRLPLLKNWVRPLRGPENMFGLTREDLYYSDMRPWKVRKQYDEVMRQLRASSCREIAMDITYFQLEYPIQALLLKEHPETRFVHVNTQNPSKKYAKPSQPCALVCLACDQWLELDSAKILQTR